jgi:hypothetical protein
MKRAKCFEIEQPKLGNMIPKKSNETETHTTYETT